MGDNFMGLLGMAFSMEVQTGQSPYMLPCRDFTIPQPTKTHCQKCGSNLKMSLEKALLQC